MVLTPIGEYSHFTFGMIPICATNCTPLKAPCRIGTWKASGMFS